MPLEEQFYETAAERWKRQLPWLRLFRGFRMALDFRKLFLALIGVLAIAGGRNLFSRLPFSPESRGVAEVSDARPWPWSYDFARAPLMAAVENPIGLLMAAPLQAPAILAPFRDVLDPARALLRRKNSWSDVGWAWTQLLWALLVWAVIGVAISRIAALEIAGQGTPSLRGSLRHSTRYLVSSLGAPLLSIIGIALFWILAAVIGLLGRLPGIGPTLVGLLWFAPLIFGGMLALILIGVGAAWPLMYCTISVEASDAFDALSRAYSYVFGRPWYALFLSAMAAVYGSAVLLFLLGAARFAVELTDHSVGSGWNAEAVDMLTAHKPQLFKSPPDVQDSTGPEVASANAGTPLTGAWLKLVASLLTAFVFSYFWTTSTICYFLLRRAEDATPLNQVYWSGGPADHSTEPALSGMAAAEEREQQKSAASGDSPRAEPSGSESSPNQDSVPPS